MMHSFRMYVVLLRVRFQEFLRKLGTRTMSTAALLLRRIFLPAGDDHVPAQELITSDRLERLRYLAWLSRRQTRLARRFGTFSRELLERGQSRAAREIAWGAFLHWKSARAADRKFVSQARTGPKIAA